MPRRPRDPGAAPPPRARPARRAGQAYLESLLALFVLLLALFGALQAALLFGEAEILHHAAARAARARTVGFNDWMAEKAARVASIPVAGRLLAEETGYAPAPNDGGPAAFERARIPFYLAAENRARAEWILDYEEWRDGRFAFSVDGSGLGVIRGRAFHDSPLRLPLAEFIAPGARRDEEGVPRLPLEGEGVAGDHADLYLAR